MSSRKKSKRRELFSSIGSRKTRAHTPVDHRTGGPPVPLRAGAVQWAAVELVHVRADRAPAAVAASETLVELLGRETDVLAAAIFVSRHQRRVATFVWLTGHESYAKLQHAWDEHHLEREHREAVEKRDLSMCRVVAVAGDPTIKPGAHIVTAIERLALTPSTAAQALAVLETAQPPGFIGAALFGADDDTHGYLMHRWEHKENVAAFRESPAAIAAFGPAGPTGDAYELYELARTFGPPSRDL